MRPPYPSARASGLLMLSVWLGSPVVHAQAPTPIDQRRLEAARAIDARLRLGPEDPSVARPNRSLTNGGHEYDYQDKAAAIFARIDAGEAPAARADEANQLLRYSMMGPYSIASAGQLVGDSGRWMHRSRTLGMRLWLLYGHFMDADLATEHRRRLEWMLREPYEESSENIRSTHNSSFLLAHEALGETARPSYRALVSWLQARLQSWRTDGMHEWGSEYAAWTLIAMANVAELSTHAELRGQARAFVDHALARQLEQSVGPHFASARVRSYLHWSANGYVPALSSTASLWFGTGPISDRTWADFVISNATPLALHRAQQRLAAPGVGVQRDDTAGGRAWRHHTARGRDYLLSVHQSLDGDGYALPSGGTHDVILAIVQSSASPRGVVIPYPYTPTTPYSKKRNLAHRAFGHGSSAFVLGGGTTMPVWAGGGRVTEVPARLFHDVSFRVVLEGGWAFLTDGRIYVGWAPTVGDPELDPEAADFGRPSRDGGWLRSTHRPGPQGELAVLEVGDASTHADFAAFRAELLRRNPRPRLSGGAVDYRSRDGATMRIDATGASVDGVAYDPSAHPRAATAHLSGQQLDVGGEVWRADQPDGAHRLPRRLELGRPPAPPTPTPGAPIGEVRTADGGRLSGWAFAPGARAATVRITAEGDGRSLVEIRATGPDPRPRVQREIAEHGGSIPTDDAPVLWEVAVPGRGTRRVRAWVLDANGGAPRPLPSPDGRWVFEVDADAPAPAPDAGTPLETDASTPPPVEPDAGPTPDAGVPSVDASTPADSDSTARADAGPPAAEPLPRLDGGCRCADAPGPDGRLGWTALVLVLGLGLLRRRRIGSGAGLIALLVLLGAGCVPEARSGLQQLRPVARPDAAVAEPDGGLVDAGPPPDATAPEDVGPRLDAGHAEDAGPKLDAGAPTDAGLAVDAATPDAGPPPPDAGPPDGCPPGFSLLGAACAPDAPEPFRSRAEAEVCGRWASDVVTVRNEWTATDPSNACDLGTVSEDAYANAILRTNVYRWLAGLDPISEDVARRPAQQACAVIQRALGRLNHYPPADSPCYTPEGAGAAGSSNLAMGGGSLAASVELYVGDRGVGSLGHRRWLLNPRALVTSFGYKPPYSCMYSFSNGARADPDFVAWPPPGWVPVTAARGEWSFASTRFAPRPDTVVELSIDGAAPVVVEGHNPGGNYGWGTVVAFTPPGDPWRAGTVVQVSLRGTRGGDVAYTVAFSGCR